MGREGPVKREWKVIEQGKGGRPVVALVLMGAIVILAAVAWVAFCAFIGFLIEYGP